MHSDRQLQKQAIAQEQEGILQQLEDWLDLPMLLLSGIWLLLFIVELIWGLTPFLEGFSLAIWILFIAQFALEFLLAPRKLAYLKRNWLTTISLLLPALRMVRFIRLFGVLRNTSAIRGVRLLRVMSQTNRGMQALADSFSRRGFGYVMGITAIVVPLGAAAMYAFEQEVPGTGLSDYGTALWWTAMLMTTLGADYSPQSPEGRILCFLLAVYASAVFGYLTATIATFFIGRDANNDEAELAGAKSVSALQDEIAALRAEIQALSQRFPGDGA